MKKILWIHLQTLLNVVNSCSFLASQSPIPFQFRSNYEVAMDIVLLCIMFPAAILSRIEDITQEAIQYVKERRRRRRRQPEAMSSSA